MTWASGGGFPRAGGGGGASPTDVLTTQGDLLSQNPSGTYVRIPRGTNGQLLTLAANIPAYTAAPSGTVLDWQWQLTSTANADPAVGECSLNNASWSSVTTIKIGNGTLNSAGDPSSFFINLNSITGTNKAYIHMWNSTTRAKWAVYSIQATASGGGGFNVTFTVTSFGSQTNPAINDLLYARIYPCA